MDLDRVVIVDFEPHHRDAFRDLNLAWNEELFAVEELDRRQLNDPEAAILRRGGAIVVAELDQDVVGVCALVPTGPGHFEVAKMATRKDLRGSGIGRKLMSAVLLKGRELGAHRLSLLSHSSLAPALRLYRSFGFTDVPVPAGNEYARADVAMELELR